MDGGAKKKNAKRHPHTRQELERLNKYGCGRNNREEKTMRSSHARKLDRSKKLQEGIPDTEQWAYGNKIRYNQEQNVATSTLRQAIGSKIHEK